VALEEADIVGRLFVVVETVPEEDVGRRELRNELMILENPGSLPVAGVSVVDSVALDEELATAVPFKAIVGVGREVANEDSASDMEVVGFVADIELCDSNLEVSVAM
jgi:hypothetical protein